MRFLQDCFVVLPGDRKGRPYGKRRVYVPMDILAMSRSGRGSDVTLIATHNSLLFILFSAFTAAIVNASPERGAIYAGG